MRNAASILTLLVLLLVALLALVPAPSADAASAVLRFNSLGVYPQLATSNSQRWFRLQVTWDNGVTDAGDDEFGDPIGFMVNERVIAVTMDTDITFNGGYGGNMYSTRPGGGGATNGTNVGVVVDSAGGNSTVLTVGPFAGSSFAALSVGSVRTGQLGGADPASWQIYYQTHFRVRWELWDNTNKLYVEQAPVDLYPKYATCPTTNGGPFTAIGNSGEIMYWYSSNAYGIDPLALDPDDPTDPDNGSSSDRYTFRVLYWNYIRNVAGYSPTELIPTFRAPVARAMPGEGYRYARFEGYAYNVLANGQLTSNPAGKGAAADSSYGVSPWNGGNPYRDWGYSSGADGHFDYVGSHQSYPRDGGPVETNLLPQVMLIVDRNYQRPYQMTPENQTDPNNPNYTVWRYDLLPTDYMQVFNNIWSFPFDLPGSDAWDMYGEWLYGRPVENNYVALGPGGHTYEFIATRDWDPPMRQINDELTGNPVTGKIMRCIVGRPGNSLGSLDLAGGGAGVRQFGYYFTKPDAFGYQYDSQEAGQYPKVDPVLCGYPASFTNTLGGLSSSIGYPHNPEPSTVAPLEPGEPQGVEPWDDMVGPHTAGYSMPRRVTNDDTIWPNAMNVWFETDAMGYDPDLTQPSDWRGDKWTQASNYVFRIQYFQSDNLAPQLAQVLIRKVNLDGSPASTWTGKSMRKVYQTDTDYTDGCLYYFLASASELPGGGGPGDYQYSFSFTDGKHRAIFPNRPDDSALGSGADPGSIGVPAGDNDFFWFRVNKRPELSGQSVSPPTGNQGSNFVFRTTYRDRDGVARAATALGDRPFKSTVWIDLFGDPEGQAQVTGLVTSSEVSYNYASSPPAGGNIYAAGALVGKKLYFQTGAALGREFVITGNTAPGGDGTIAVTGDLAAAGVVSGDWFQIADWFQAAMEQEDPSDNNWADGCNYVMDTARRGIVLDPGTHPYYFEFWDNWGYWINWDQYFMRSPSTPAGYKIEGEMVRLPQQGYFDGPMVINNQAPHLSRFFFAPPAPDMVQTISSTNVINYLRPSDLDGYASSSLNGKYLQFYSGAAQGQVFPIFSNTASAITVTGNLVTAGVGPGDTFRVFEHYDLTNGVSYAYHVPGLVDGVEADTFTLYLTYTDADNDPPSAIRIGCYYGAPAGTSTEVPDLILDLTKVNPADTDYTDGMEYRTSAPRSFPIGDNFFRAQAKDGTLWAGGGGEMEWFGPGGHLADSAFAPKIGALPPPDSIPPSQVLPLVASSSADGRSIILNWPGWIPPAKPDDVKGYHIWIQTADFSDTTGLTAKATLNVPPDVSTYTWNGAVPGTTYYCVVTAFDEVPNEIKTPVTSVSVLAADSQGPVISNKLPQSPPNASLTPTISFQAADASGVDLTQVTMTVAVNADPPSAVTLTKVPNTGTPTTVTASYVGSYAWNDAITVAVQAKDTFGNTSTDSWTFNVTADISPPTLTDKDPAQGSGDVVPTDPITFHLRDDVSGLDLSSISVLVNGAPVTAPDLVVNSSNLKNVILTYTKPGGFAPSATVIVRINAKDRAGNVMSEETWTFTTAHAISGYVTDTGANPVEGVMVTNGTVDATTDINGFYSLLGVPNGTYTVVPSKAYFSFTPVTRSVTVAGSSVGNVNFTATPLTYTVRGVIRDTNGAGVGGVSVNDGIHAPVLTDSIGRYTLPDLLPGPVTITPSSGIWTFLPVSRTVTVPTAVSQDFTAYPFYTHPSGTLGVGVYMLGVPFDPTNRDPVAVFSTPLIRRWNPLGVPPSYRAPGDAGSAALLEVRPGRGFFTKYTAPTLLSGSGTPTSTSAPYVISLGPQWNMIANPYPVAVPVGNLTPALLGGTTPYVFSYDTNTGSYLFLSATAGINVSRTFLLPWEGAWIRSLVGTTSVSVTAPPGASSVQEVKPQALAVGKAGYIIPVVAEAGGRADLCSAAGVSVNGRYEIANPPTAPQSVDVYFLDEAGNPLAQSVQPASVSSHSWKFVVATDIADSDVAVRLPDLSQVPADLSVTLVDEDANKVVYMRTTSQYLFRSDEQGAVRHFRLEVAPNAGASLVINTASAQQAGRGVVVTYSVSQPCALEAEILNIAGRVVRRLGNGAVAGGVNTLSWNLRSDQGALVPSGMYLVRLQAKAESGQAVQALLQINVGR